MRFFVLIFCCNRLLNKEAVMILPLLYYPDVRLRTIAKEVQVIDDGVRTLVQDMFDTMYAAEGIGLAGTQVDRHLRVVVMDLAKEGEPPKPRVFINPVVTALTDELAPYQEGCLSIPEVYDDIERPTRVHIQYLDLDGKMHDEEADGLLAVCIQHEIDHLNGVLFVDYLSNLKQTRACDKVKKVLRQKEKEKA